MSRYLVIGANSQLAQAIILQLKKSEKTIEIWRTTSKTQSSIKNKLLHMNLQHPYLPDYKFHCAFFCAAITSIATCEKNPNRTKHINLTNTVKLSQALSNAGCKIIFPSTNLVFEGTKALYKTSDTPNPIPLYARYKAATESAILKLSNKNTVIRLSKILPPDYALFSHWIKQLKKGENISAFYNMSIAPVSINFASSQIVSIAKYHKSGIWHISAKSDVSYFDIALYIADKLNISTDRVRPEDANKIHSFVPPFSSLDASVTDKTLDMQTPDSWQIIKENIGNMI